MACIGTDKTRQCPWPLFWKLSSLHSMCSVAVICCSALISFGYMSVCGWNVSWSAARRYSSAHVGFLHSTSCLLSSSSCLHYLLHDQGCYTHQSGDGVLVIPALSHPRLCFVLGLGATPATNCKILLVVVIVESSIAEAVETNDKNELRDLHRN